VAATNISLLLIDHAQWVRITEFRQQLMLLYYFYKVYQAIVVSVSSGLVAEQNGITVTLFIMTKQKKKLLKLPR